MASDKVSIAEGGEPPLTQQQIMDNPLKDRRIEFLNEQVKRLHERYFTKKKIKVKDANGKVVEKEATVDSATLKELQIGARLARNYGYHPVPPPRDLESTSVEDDAVSLTSTTESVTGFIEDRVWAAIRIQQSKKLWQEPKDLLVTIFACCMASMTQGWNQAANGNLGWPQDLKLRDDPYSWTFGAVNAITWFAAAVLGPLVVDPVCYARWFGRRGSVFLAATFSLAATIGGSRATSWQGYLIARLFLGIGIGAKASIVPIWESEVLPPSKRGRVLVSWQVFTAIGIFFGSVATYIFRDTWRNQVLSAAIPAFILLILTYLCCESPRWLIIQGKYPEAFETLVRLRKERILAAEEFCYIYFQIQNERAFARGKEAVDFNFTEDKLSYTQRLGKVFEIRRNQNAAIASMIVMLSQQLSGINILAFLASVFFTAAKLTDNHNAALDRKRNLGLAIGFGAANAIFSAIAYFWIEPLPPGTSMRDLRQGNARTVQNTQSKETNSNDDGKKAEKKEKQQKERQEQINKLQKLLYGRRRLLLQSLAGGTVTLFILTFLLMLPASNPSKLGAVTFFVFVFTLFYSPGAGAVPFLYSAEIWPNEGREVGMSWAVFWNFLGSGFLALFVPRGLAWGPDKLFGLFTGLSFFAFILVYFLVPSVNKAKSLEQMTTIFRKSLGKHTARKAKHIIEIKNLGTWAPYVRSNPKNDAVGTVPKNDAVETAPKNDAVETAPKNDAVETAPTNPSGDPKPSSTVNTSEVPKV